MNTSTSHKPPTSVNCSDLPPTPGQLSIICQPVPEGIWPSLPAIECFGCLRTVWWDGGMILSKCILDETCATLSFKLKNAIQGLFGSAIKLRHTPDPVDHSTANHSDHKDSHEPLPCCSQQGSRALLTSLAGCHKAAVRPRTDINCAGA
jgi:hypothetical protein